MRIIEDISTNLVSQALDAAVLRQQAIAQNLANINTPGYKRLSVAFEAQLAGASRNASPSQVAMQAPRLIQAAEAGGVSTDVELAQLSETVLHHHALLKALEKHMGLLRTAVSEGKK